MRPAQSYSISSKYCHDKGTVKRRGLVVGGCGGGGLGAVKRGHSGQEQR